MCIHIYIYIYIYIGELLSAVRTGPRYALRTWDTNDIYELLLLLLLVVVVVYIYIYK